MVGSFGSLPCEQVWLQKHFQSVLSESSDASEPFPASTGQVWFFFVFLFFSLLGLYRSGEFASSCSVAPARVAWSRVLAVCSVGAAADGEQGVTRRERDPCCLCCLSRGCFAEFDFTKSFPSTSAPCLVGTGLSLRAPRGRRTLCSAGQAVSSSCCPPPPPHGQLYLHLPVPGAQLRCKRRRVSTGSCIFG